MPPSDPAPAPTDISPVGFSVTSKFTIFELAEDPSSKFEVTFENKPLALRLFTDFAFSNSL